MTSAPQGSRYETLNALKRELGKMRRLLAESQDEAQLLARLLAYEQQRKEARKHHWADDRVDDRLFVCKRCSMQARRTHEVQEPCRGI